ncbi:ProQ/FinO family protein [Candidatus Albibeggiatoa sp. nov. NOAA]|uniref:ProQ/FinO family protein n=1 Tax=Candidatus Albibeggiatoa sp. nov. NOAA TaxID=3162724 RepID=UPI0032F98EFC|nr:ProQ/FinO family protein [Thiotrichaceae bacterium]
MSEQNTPSQEEQQLSPEDMLQVLKQRFPKAFVSQPEQVKPLKVNIHLDIRERCADEFSNRVIARALKLYAKNKAYLTCLTANAKRIDLDGNECGEVTDEHMELAQQDKEKKHKTQHEAENAPIENPVPEGTPPISVRLEINLKITELPSDVRTTKNGWQEFFINADKYPVKVVIRPKTWNKLLKASTDFPYWIASITGKMGHKIKYGGFELQEPVIQIFQRFPKNAANSDNATPKADAE